jgi:flavorubredoxin
MRAVELKKNVYWVGAVDWNLRDFHGYSTEKGTSYNAYLVKNEKTVLFDTVKVEFFDDLLTNIKSITDPEKIDYLVVNHAEMDHTGALPKILNIVKPEKLFCTARCKEFLIAQHHQEEWPFEIVKEGDSLNIGSKNIRFFDSKMLHWPESMVSYLEEDHILISNDIFGQHWATSERFDDEVDQGELYLQSAKYYANIFYPFSTVAKKFLAKLKENKLKLDMLATDHGLIWRKDVSGILNSYENWSSHQSENKAVVVYATMWGSTRKMAEAVSRGISDENVSVKLLDLGINHRSDVITEILNAKAVVLGSSVLNNGILPVMADFLSYMKGLKPGKKMGAAFGSYGWADKGVKILNEMLEGMKFEIISDGVSAKYVPTDDKLKECREFSVEIAKKILQSE